MMVEDDDWSRLVFGKEASDTTCDDFSITAPPTLVVLCTNLSMGEMPPVIEVNENGIRRIEISESADASGSTTEIRVFTDTLLEYRVTPLPPVVLLVSLKTSAPEPPPTPERVAATDPPASPPIRPRIPRPLRERRRRQERPHRIAARRQEPLPPRQPWPPRPLRPPLPAPPTWARRPSSAGTSTETS